MRLKLLILPIALVVTIIIAVFYIEPSFSEMMSAKKSLGEMQTQLANLKSQNQKLQNVKQKWASLGDEKMLVATALPDTEDIDFYISELFSKASRSGVLLSNVKQDQTNNAATVKSAAYVCDADSSGGNASPAGSPVSSPGAGNLSGSENSADECLKTVAISMTAKGSWQQMLDFFKYLEDMNRISNIKTASLSTDNQLQGQSSSDLLVLDISTNAFFKAKDQNGNAAQAGSLAAQDFNQKAIQKLKETIYAPYDMPAVSPGGERNLFK